jgi:hypothetical protein
MHVPNGSTESLSEDLDLSFLSHAIKEPISNVRMLLKRESRPVGYPFKVGYAIPLIAYCLQRSFADLLASRRGQVF